MGLITPEPHQGRVVMVNTRVLAALCKLLDSQGQTLLYAGLTITQ